MTIYFVTKLSQLAFGIVNKKYICYGDPEGKIMSERYPTVGRIVHFYEPGTPPSQAALVARAAIVVATNKEQPDLGQHISLMICRPYGPSVQTRVSFSERPRAECWSWPTNE